MKRLSFYLLSCVMVAFIFTSCEMVDTSFDETLLIGKWKSGTEYYRYDTQGSGVTWDTADDVTEEEGQAFTWTLQSSSLTHIHIMQTGGNGVPKIYTVTELTATTLSYKDDFKSYTFAKVN